MTSKPFDPQTFVGPSLEPPEPPPACTWCDGECLVDVAAVYGVDGNRFEVDYGHGEQIKCPHCGTSGTEPELDPRDDPLLDDRIKERRHGGGR